MKDFAHRIKALRAEVEALKAVKRKSSITLNTITKTATCYSTIYRADGSGFHAAGSYVLRRIGQIEIIPTDGAPMIFSYSLQPYAERTVHTVSIDSWLTDNDNPGLLARVNLYANGEWDNIPLGGTLDVPITVYITATADFTTNSSQLSFDPRT